MGDGVVLSCAGCGKTFRLRGHVRADARCPACGSALAAPNAASEQADAPQSPRAARPRGPRVPEDATTRQQANRALATAKQNLLMIRVGLIVPAIGFGLLFVLLLLASEGPAHWSLWLTGAVCVAATVGAVFVLRRPLLCTLLNALLATPLGLLAVQSLLAGSMSLFTLVTACLSIAFWLAVVMAASTERLMRRFPDLYAARALRGESTGRFADDARRESARRLKRNLLVAGGVLLLVVGVPVLLVTLKGSGGGAPSEQPPAPPSLPFASAEMTWRLAWNGDRVAQVKALLADSERPKQEPFLDRMIKKRSWTPLPVLEPPEIEASGAHRAIARYAVDGFEAALTIYWEWEKTRWVVVNWTFPNR